LQLIIASLQRQPQNSNADCLYADHGLVWYVF